MPTTDDRWCFQVTTNANIVIRLCISSFDGRSKMS
uniref:Uncharacterized protein n=1 Tax=Parascaris equorum TaxID=6256 RepID=A0A914S458_PAREQ